MEFNGVQKYFINKSKSTGLDNNYYRAYHKQ